MNMELESHKDYEGWFDSFHGMENNPKIFINPLVEEERSATAVVGKILKKGVGGVTSAISNELSLGVLLGMQLVIGGVQNRSQRKSSEMARDLQNAQSLDSAYERLNKD
jgi:hypothetical protein